MAGVLVVLAGLAGCQPLRFEKTYDFDPVETRTLDFDAPRYDQKLKIEVTSSGPAVSAYLVKTDDKAAAERNLGNGKAPADSLGGQDRSESISFEATVPAKTEYTLVVHNTTTNKATVQVKVTGR
jgi:hypothetical protein